MTLKVRYDDFTTVTRSVTPGGVVDSPRDLYLKATELMSTIDPGRASRASFAGIVKRLPR